jgi:ISXO2-like transposase domain
VGLSLKSPRFLSNRWGPPQTTNSVEGFFGVFKRGMVGVYQHCGEQHFQRYLDEFNFRYSNRAKLGVEDARRAVMATQGGEGKRLTWRRTAGEG